MKNLILEWRQDSELECKSLYVNDQKTNVYYFLPTYKHYNFMKDGNKEKEKAEVIAGLIKAGKIYPKDGNYEGFDYCGSLKIVLENIVEVAEEIPFKNHIFGSSGYQILTDEQKQETIKKNTGKSEWVQWCKMMDENFNFLTKIAIKFYPYGYTIGFVK